MKKAPLFTAAAIIVLFLSVNAEAGSRYSKQRFKTKQQAIKAGASYYLREAKGSTRKSIIHRMGSNRLHPGNFYNGRLVSKSPKGQVLTFSLPSRRLGLNKKPVLKQNVRIRELKDGWAFTIPASPNSLELNPSFQRQPNRTRPRDGSDNWVDWNFDWGGWQNGPS